LGSIHLIDTKTATERTLDSIDRPDRIAISADWVAWTNESESTVYAKQR